MNDRDAVLAANLEFYRAFAGRDFDAMEALWAQRAPVACTHPGWPVLAERTAVMESWDGIMSNPDAPRVTCFDERAYVYGDTALVLCEEEIDGGTLAASNFFVREDGAWKMAHHHAGQIVARRSEGREARRRDRPPPGRLN
mgnify:CR=1 FL=1